MSAVTRLRTNEELLLPCAPEDVWAVLADVGAYPRWWPVRLNATIVNFAADLLGTEIELKPFLARPLRIRFEEVEEPEIVRLRFFGGSLEGPGAILIEPQGNATRLCLDIDVFARGLDVAVLGLIFPLQKVHALQVRRWLRSVRSRVAATRRSAARAVEKTQTRAPEMAAPSVEAAGAPAESGVMPVTQTPIASVADGTQAGPASLPTLSAQAAEPVVNPPLTRMQTFARRAAQWLRESPHLSDVGTKDPSSSVAEPRSNFELARAYLQELSSEGGLKDGSRFFHLEVSDEEFPHALLPNGAIRGLAEILRARSDAEELWERQTFELLGAVVGGSQVTMEIAWTGKATRATPLHSVGQQARARLAMFLKFQDQLIVRQRTYVCFQPPSTEERTGKAEAISTS